MKLLYQAHTGHKPDLLSVFVYICLSLPYVIVATQALVCCLICPHSPSGIVHTTMPEGECGHIRQGIVHAYIVYAR